MMIANKSLKFGQRDSEGAKLFQCDARTDLSLHMQQEMTSSRRTTDSQKTKHSGGMTQNLSESVSTSSAVQKAQSRKS